ncbi:MAG TPA: single-stranded DNA-binding protein [Bacteroidales bacterium]|nr:single-stranded DNA-binding protein [Bacteroidales bacterium]HSA42117.1 single-stranded DNA-binding protein [Bacteroidales bacterium]
MATGVNRVILIGNLGKDPDIMTLESGVKKASFSLATTESYKNKDGSKAQITEWHNIVLWRGLAEVAESYLKKGHQIYLEGKIRTRSWDDKEGNKRYTTEILGDNLLMLGRPSGTVTAEDNGSQQETSDPVTMDIPDAGNDLPF